MLGLHFGSVCEVKGGDAPVWETADLAGIPWFDVVAFSMVALNVVGPLAHFGSMPVEGVRSMENLGG